MMKGKSAAVLRHLASPACNNVLGCLRDGMDHPDDISKKLDVVRQTVDWHLIKLSALGIVDREAVSSLSGRPRVIYKLTKDGEKLIKNIESMVGQHYTQLMKEFERQQSELDRQLARADISEEVYLEKVKKLEKERGIVESD